MQERRLGHVPALDGMRGVAVLLILGIHGVGWPIGGYLGVPLFFVLSGFLITTLLLEQEAKSGRISLRRFYGARARRLLPALVVALLGYLLISAALGAGHAYDHASFGWALRSAALSFFYVANIAQLIASGQHRLTQALGPMWSLSTEEQFYLLWPFVLILFRGRRKLLLVVVGFAALALAAHRAELAAVGAGWHRTEAIPDGVSDEILVGCALALVRWHGWIPRPRHAHVIVISALAVSCGTALLAPLTAAWSFEIGVPFFIVSIAVLIVAAVDGWEEGWTQLASLRSLRWMGRISYAAYLWDGIILWATPLHRLVGTVAVIGLAALSTRFIEEPIRRRRARLWPLYRGRLEESRAQLARIDVAA